MKKIAKLSFVAAVAVAGLTSANAGALEEAIKGVDISGTATYRYDDRDQYAGNKNTNSYKIAVNLKSKINEDLTFNTRTIIGNINGTDSDMVAISTTSADANADVTVSHANFAYTGIENTTIIAGKQAVPSPFAVQADAAGDEDTGTGLTAITSLGSVTLAATYLNQTNLATAGQDIAGLGAMANVGPVSFDAWYLDVAETSTTNDGAKAYTIGAKAKVDIVKMYARYSAVDFDGSDEKESLWKIGVSAKLGIVSLGVDYGQTNDVATKSSVGVGLTGDADADVNLQGWATNSLYKKDDASLLKVTGKIDLMSNVNFALTYADMTVDGTTAQDDMNEVYGQLTYKAGKNFMTYVRFGQVDDDTKADKGYRGRLHVQYTF